MSSSSQQDNKFKTSVSLDRDLVEILDSIPAVKRSPALNKAGWEWLAANGYIDEDEIPEEHKNGT